MALPLKAMAPASAHPTPTRRVLFGLAAGDGKPSAPAPLLLGLFTRKCFHLLGEFFHFFGVNCDFAGEGLDGHGRIATV